jgi:hypothetical protein
MPRPLGSVGDIAGVAQMVPTLVKEQMIGKPECSHF